MQLIINEYVSKSSQNLVHYLSCQGCWTYCISWFLLRPYSYRPYRTWPRDGLGFKGPTLALRVEDLALRFWPWRHHWAIVVFSLRLVIHLQHINFRSTHFSTQTSCRRVADLASSWFQISSFLSPSCYSTPQQDRHPRGLSLTGSLGTSSTSRQLRPWFTAHTASLLLRNRCAKGHGPSVNLSRASSCGSRVGAGDVALSLDSSRTFH